MIKKALTVLSVLLAGYLFLAVGFETAKPPGPAYLVRETVRTLSKDSMERKAKEMTYRVRNTSCLGIGTGSAFVTRGRYLITNRHVLQGAALIELSSWDGKSIRVPSRKAAVAAAVDIGALELNKPVGNAAQEGPKPDIGDKVTAVGYPEGDEIQLLDGKVKRYANGRNLGGVAFAGEVMVISSPVRPGNSGGPVMDSKGRVVGVVYAGKTSYTGQITEAYAIPMSEVRRLIKRGARGVSSAC